MSQVLMGTFCDSLRRAFVTNSDATSFASLVPTTTEPTTATDGVIDLSTSTVQNNNLLLIPFGAGADDTTFSLRVTGWKKAIPPSGGTATVIWIPVPLYQINCTLCTAVGVASAVVINTDRFCDTLAITMGNELTDCTKISPSSSTAAVANIIGSLILDMKGFARVQITLDMTGATNGNALYAAL